MKWNITVATDWAEYIGYVNWRKQVESQIWTGGMSIKEKCDAAKNYIKINFTYKLGYGQAILIYGDRMCDCIGASDLMGGFAKDANAQLNIVVLTVLNRMTILWKQLLKVAIHLIWYISMVSGHHTMPALFRNSCTVE